MEDDLAQLQDRLSAQWQKTALELVNGGVPAQMVFDTLMTVGIAGRVEVQGKRAAAEALLAIARKLADQAHEEAEAMAAAEHATKN